jgi:DNA uptake protein ComE-like DNA-binding protein
VLGERIIEARPFDSVEDVTRVKGIGEKTVEQWGDRVKF